MIDVKDGSKSIKKSKKTVCQTKTVFCPGKIKIRILVFSLAALTAVASIGASSTHEFPDVKVDDDGAFTTFPRSSSEKGETFHP